MFVVSSQICLLLYGINFHFSLLACNGFVFIQIAPIGVIWGNVNGGGFYSGGYGFNIVVGTKGL
jgi:hypothetical protein